MWLRAGAAGVVSRAVPAAGDRKARLQSIGWLAGNLARDQVGAVVAGCPRRPPSPWRPPRRSPPHAPRCRRRFRPRPPADQSTAVRRERGPRGRGSTGRRRLDGALGGRRRRRRLRVVIDARRWTIGLVSGRPRPKGLARSGRLVPGASAAAFVERPDRRRGAGRGTRHGAGGNPRPFRFHGRRCLGRGQPPLREDLRRGDSRPGPGGLSIDG